MNKTLFNNILYLALGVILLISAGRISAFNSFFSNEVQIFLGAAMIVFTIIDFICKAAGKNSVRFSSYFLTITGFLFLVVGFLGMAKRSPFQYSTVILAIGTVIFLRGFLPLLQMKLPNHGNTPVHELKSRRLIAYITITIMVFSLFFIPLEIELFLIPLVFIFLLFLTYGGGFQGKTMSDRLPLYLTIIIFIIYLILLSQSGQNIISHL